VQRIFLDSSETQPHPSTLVLPHLPAQSQELHDNRLFIIFLVSRIRCCSMRCTVPKIPFKKWEPVTQYNVTTQVSGMSNYTAWTALTHIPSFSEQPAKYVSFTETDLQP
jgi:hypothetical protein